MFGCQAHTSTDVFLLFLFCISPISANQSDIDDEVPTTLTLVDHDPQYVPLGINATLICKTRLVASTLWWTFRDANLTEDAHYVLEREAENINPEEERTYEISILYIIDVQFTHIGEYKCHAIREVGDELELDFAKIVVNVSMAVTILQHAPTVRTLLHETVHLACLIQGYPLDAVGWKKDGHIITESDWIRTSVISDTVRNTSITVHAIEPKDNGTYTCYGQTPVSQEAFDTAILVLDKPQVSIELAKAIGANSIYLKWSLNDGNAPNNLHYRIQYMLEGGESWLFYQSQISAEAHAIVLRGVFRNSTSYMLRMTAINDLGESQYAVSQPVETLAEDPVFIPLVKVTGVTVSSITVSWTEPPTPLKEYIHYYQLASLNNEGKGFPTEAIIPAKEGHLYMLRDLQPATTYQFQVASCSEFSKLCGPNSIPVNGTTNDGISGPPADVHIECRFDGPTGASSVVLTWKAPHSPHGTIMSYNVNLEGNATFINDMGLLEQTTWGPKVTSISENMLVARFYNVSANTNYTVRVAAVTRSKRNGQTVERRCTMPATVPDKHRFSKVTWRKLETQGRWIFKLHMPRVSERNGPICCYRIYLVRMESQQTLSDLPAPAQLEIVSFQEAHRTPKGGAYVAETFTSSAFHNEIFLGDDDETSHELTNETRSACDECIGLRPYGAYGAQEGELPSNNHSTPSSLSNRVRRSLAQLPLEPLPARDGHLDYNSNYTGFVEVIVRGNGDASDATLAAYSSYLTLLNPGPEVVEAPPASTTLLAVQVLCALVLVTVILLAALYMLREYTKQAHAQAVEMITFRTSLRNLRGRQRLVSLNPPDMCPIGRSDLPGAYVERHRDSDYGFQQEFELLPDRFSDRTTRASDARENVYKNRYPDIKAYDQTRVKLSQVDSIAGSDYVNANFVLSYKERKKFICAQGPMDNTVNEFWRMVWEQHLELVLMLTNLEEYSKTKCSKYWPDKNDMDKVFGDIGVTHVTETRYSDYIVRELRIGRRDHRDHEERTITQYHYLVWKDFMAPEHPHGIIKFIKRMNEAYSPERGSILVHCSAGVGRTGTLVALDCLLQQLKEEGQVSIFNTICDLRHQRNFLVQSLKQYIFIYRALMEVAQYGDTEIPANELKATVEKLKICEKEKVRSKMEEDFENMKNAYEERKSCSVAGGQENHEKNRCDSVLPYDRNRVILTPLSGREHSTYINATFVEGYDNTESFIIAQDPLECTIPDFWRMIAEQSVSVVVMLSEVSEAKCPRYWPEVSELETDSTRSYEHITVRYAQAETCPYYTRREMFVRSRDGDEHRVVHLQYHGWPTVDGEVPEVTRGLIELVDQAHAALATPNSEGATSTSTGSCTPGMVVHCSLGGDRSSMFVGLAVLVQQLRNERRVDVFTVVRKLRSQRQEMISTYPQYELLHRAIVNYAELHGLCES